jgi:hypothetical protein
LGKVIPDVSVYVPGKIHIVLPEVKEGELTAALIVFQGVPPIAAIESLPYTSSTLSVFPN